MVCPRTLTPPLAGALSTMARVSMPVLLNRGCTALFLLPFASFGMFVLVKGIRSLVNGDMGKGEAIGMVAFGAVLSSRRGASKLQDEFCFLCLPPGFPAVPRYFVHTGLSRPPLSEPCLRYLRTRLLTLPFTRNHNKSTCTGGLGRANMLTRMRGRGSGNRFSIRLNFSQVMPFL